MRLHQVVLAVLVTFSAVLASNALHAAKKPSEADLRREQQQKKLTKTLQAESLGATTERAARLKALIADGTDLDQAYWQAGYVKYGDKWIPLDEPLFTSAEMKQREAYVNYRKQFWGNDEENLKIARWCAEFNLADQARAHLMAVLLNRPGNAELRQLLGYQRIAGRWMNAVEYVATIRERERLMKNLQKWLPVAIRIRDGLSQSSPSTRNAALRELAKTDVDAVPALEITLLGLSEEIARHCVEQLREIRRREATLSLCRAAMFCPWKSVKFFAVDELKERPLQDYVPDILSRTRTNHTLNMEFYWNNPKITAREFDEFFKIASVTVGYEEFTQTTSQSYRDGMRLSVIRNGLPPTADELQRFFDRYNNARLRLRTNPFSAATSTDGILQSEQKRRTYLNGFLATSRHFEEQKQRDVDYNQRATDLLNSVSNDAQFTNIEDVWKWWNNRMDLGLDLDNKPDVENVVEFVEAAVPVPVYLPAHGYGCFIKGTPVYSEIGPVPIETLRVGDHVLAQNVDTGELTYKPVIRTTIRQTHKSLCKIALGRDSITATPGHLFWVSGTGWVKARDLKPGYLVHTATGAVKVESVTSAPEEATHNLVVDGFHTYFVGNERALVHDVSLTAPTDAVVPGLIER